MREQLTTIHGYIKVKERAIYSEYRVSGNNIREIVVCGEKIAVNDEEIKDKRCWKTRLNKEREISIKNTLVFTGLVEYFPPPSYAIPASFPNPYKRFNIRLIVDSDPKVSVKGLEEIHSTVIGTTKRTILEGYSYPQLIIYRSGATDIQESCNSTLYLYKPISLFYSYPILGPTIEVDWAKYCEKSLDNWGLCVLYASKILKLNLCRYMLKTNIRKAVKEKKLSREQLTAYKLRLWWPLLQAQQKDLSLIKEIVEKKTLTLDLFRLYVNTDEEFEVRNNTRFLNWVKIMYSSNLSWFNTSILNSGDKILIKLDGRNPYSPALITACIT